MVGREPGHLVERVADEQDRDPGLAAQPVEVGQDLALAGLVERGQRLVEQEQAGCREQGRGRSRPAAARRPTAVPGRRSSRCRCPGARRPRRGCRAAGGGRRTSGRRAGCGARSDAGTAGRPGTRSRCAGDGAARRCRARCRAAARRRARCGRGRAAADRRSQLMIVVLPAPERPNRAVTPSAAVKRTSSFSAPSGRELDLEHQMPRTIRATGRASSSEAIMRGEGEARSRPASGAGRRTRRRGPG